MTNETQSSQTESGTNGNETVPSKPSHPWWLWAFGIPLAVAVAIIIWSSIDKRAKILDWPLRDAITILVLFLLFLSQLVFGLLPDPKRQREHRLLAGSTLILFAVGTYVSTLALPTTIKPWLLAFFVLSAVASAWLLGTALIGIPIQNEVQQLRRVGSGMTVSATERQNWVKLQTMYANWLAMAIGGTIFLSLALYIANHVTVMLANSPTAWQTHLTTNEYITQPDDTLLAAAAALDTDVGKLAAANPTIIIQTPVTRTSTLSSTQWIGPTGIDGRSLDVVARELSTTPEKAALGFTTIELISNQVLEIPSSGPRLWIDWILWGVVGIGAYLLIEGARYYREIPIGKGDFVNETPWYFTQLITGPLIAFVVLAILTRIDFSVLGQTEDAAISVNLSQLPYDVMFGLAFLLGFFSRVARKLLELIAQSLFRPAWSAAAGAFDIQIKDKSESTAIGSGEWVVFTTEPLVADIEWKASAGELDGATYKAPDVGEETASVVITALVNDGSRRKVARMFEIVPHKYAIEAEGDAVVRADRPTHLHFVSDTTCMSEAQQKEVYWHWKPEDASVTPKNHYGKDVEVRVLEPPNEPTDFEVVAAYRGHTVCKQMTLLPRSLEGIEASVSVNGQDGDQSQPLTSPASVAVGDTVEFHVVHNLSVADVERIEWRATQGDQELDLPQSTGKSIRWEIKAPDAGTSNKIELVAGLPDGTLEDRLTFQLEVEPRSEEHGPTLND